jgi:RNA recognition motif-containing protein
MKIFVKKLALKTTESTLRSQFEKFGEVSSVTIVMDLEAKHKRSKGFGFVVMPSEKDGNAAIKALQKYKIDGKIISIKEAGDTMARTPRKPEKDTYDKKPYDRKSGKGSYDRKGGKDDKKPYDRKDGKKKGSNGYEKKEDARPKKTKGREGSKKWDDRKTAAKKNKPFYKRK